MYVWLCFELIEMEQRKQFYLFVQFLPDLFQKRRKRQTFKRLVVLLEIRIQTWSPPPEKSSFPPDLKDWMFHVDESQSHHQQLSGFCLCLCLPAVSSEPLHIYFLQNSQSCWRCLFSLEAFSMEQKVRVRLCLHDNIQLQLVNTETGHSHQVLRRSPSVTVWQQIFSLE